MSHHKNEIRKLIRAKRKALSKQYQDTYAQQVYQHIVGLNRYRLSQHIAFYLSNEGELNPELVLLHAHQAGKQCYLPVLHPQKVGTLVFSPYAPGDDLVANRFGILEPHIKNLDHHLPFWQLDLVFMPLVAFDQHRNRLGMGKGYYDRTFESFKQNSSHKPFLVGLAYHMQEVQQLITEPHDVKLDMIVTEKGIIT